MVGHFIVSLFLITLSIIEAPATSQTLVDTSTTCGDGQSQVLFSLSTTNGRKSGTFNTPGWPSEYPVDVRCLFRFHADVGQKVKIQFTHFNVEGSSSECTKDFVDVYIDPTSLDPTNQTDVRINEHLRDEVLPTTTTPSGADITPVLIRSSILGRFCGHSLASVPNFLVSLHRSLFLDFYADVDTRKRYNQDRHMGRIGFNGTFEFISDDDYYPGRAQSVKELPIPGIDDDQTSLTEAFLASVYEQESLSCRYLISASSSSSLDNINPHIGHIKSPAYPGLHPAKMDCAYRFKPNSRHQRVRLVIRDLYTTKLKDQCIHDTLAVYDSGKMDPTRLLGKFCGHQENLTFISSNMDGLLVVAISNRANLFLASRKSMAQELQSILQYRGYSLDYEFTTQLLSIPENLREVHVPGTECDFRILSRGQTTGRLSFPEPGDVRSNEIMASRPNLECNFIFFGLHNTSLMEVTNLNFTEITIPFCHHGYYTITGNRDGFTQTIKLTKDQSQLLETLKAPKQKMRLCRHGDSSDDKLSNFVRDVASPLGLFTSKGSVYTLTLRSDGKRGPMSGLSLVYRFIKDFGIPGRTVNPERCQFIYEDDDETGEVKYTYSPLYPENYPNNMVCVYLFKDYLQVVEIRGQEKIDATRERDLVQDAYEVLDVMNDTLRWMNHYGKLDRVFLTGTFCGETSPGPVISSSEARGVLLRFHSDSVETASGFAIGYDFIAEPEPLQGHVIALGTDDDDDAAAAIRNVCRGNLVSRTGSGILYSPNFPDRYPSNLNCEWQINVDETTTTGKSLLIHFVDFSLEGSLKNCSNAQVRVYEGSSLIPSMAICGLDSFVKSFVTTKSYLRVVFQTSEKSIGSRGFKMVWTELLSIDEKTGQCIDGNGFHCQVTKYCIPANLECDNRPNCGTFSDRRLNDLIQDTSDEAQCITTSSQSSIQIGVGVFMTIIVLGLLIVFLLYRENGRKSMKAASMYQENFPDSKAFFADSMHNSIACSPGDVGKIMAKKKKSEKRTLRSTTTSSSGGLLVHDELTFPQAKDFMKESESPPKHRHIYQVEDLTRRSTFSLFRAATKQTPSKAYYQTTATAYDKLNSTTHPITSPYYISDSSYNNNTKNNTTSPYSPITSIPPVAIVGQPTRKRSINYSSPKNVVQYMMGSEKSQLNNDKLQKVSMV